MKQAGLLLLFALFASLLLPGCGKRETPVQAATRENILLCGNGADPADLDPHLATGVAEYKILSALFEGLVIPDPKTLDPLPGVAESWEISDDGLVYRFRLRSNARWSNGDPLTAEDFRYAYQRILTPALGSEYAKMLFPIKNARAFQQGEIHDFSLVGVRAPEDHLLEIELEHPISYFLSMLFHNSYFPVHRQTIEPFGGIATRGSRWTRPGNLVSNGPFILTDWNIHDRVSVRKNPHYWNKEHIALEGIDFFPITNQNAEERAFRGGQLHVTDSLPLGKRKSYVGNASPYLRTDPWLGTYYYILNVEKPPFNDPRIRRAFNLAINRKALVDTVTLGKEGAATTFVPPGIGNYKGPSGLKEDIAEAQRLLAEAGYPDGEGFPTVELLYNTSEMHRPIAEALQHMWQENLNVQVSLVNQSWMGYLEARRNRDYTIARAGWIGDYYDPTTFLDIWKSDSGINHTGWKSDAFDQAMQAAASTADPEKRNRHLQEAESILLQELPLIPLFYYNRIYLMRPEVQGWYPNILDIHPWQFVELQAQQ